MTSIAVDTKVGRAARLWASPIGKKAVMALTGVILAGFLVVHMAGNLQVFIGREQMNNYSRMLHENPGMLWTARGVLILSIVLHIVATIQLVALKRAARPVGYRKYSAVGSTLASRTMMLTGPLVLAYIIYHLRGFTFGGGHPSFNPDDVYGNVVSGFQVTQVAVIYIVAMVLLGGHLIHGLWSMFQSLGLYHPRYTPKLRLGAVVASAVIIGGFISVPVAVLAGWIN